MQRQESEQRFYIFGSSGQGLPVGSEHTIADQEFILPFIHAIQGQPASHWAITGTHAETSSKALQQINKQIALRKKPLLVDQVDDISHYLDETFLNKGQLFLKLKIGNTIITVNQKIFLNFLSKNVNKDEEFPTKLIADINAQAKCASKLIEIFLALDQAQLLLHVSKDLTNIGIIEIEAPEEYQDIDQHNITYFDATDGPSPEADIIKQAGFNFNPLPLEPEHLIEILSETAQLKFKQYAACEAKRPVVFLTVAAAQNTDLLALLKTQGIKDVCLLKSKNEEREEASAESGDEEQAEKKQEAEQTAAKNISCYGFFEHQSCSLKQDNAAVLTLSDAKKNYKKDINKFLCAHYTNENEKILQGLTNYIESAELFLPNQNNLDLAAQRNQGEFVISMKNLQAALQTDLEKQEKQGVHPKDIYHSPAAQIAIKTQQLLIELMNVEDKKLIPQIFSDYEQACMNIKRSKKFWPKIAAFIFAGLILGAALGGAVGFGIGVWAGPGALMSAGAGAATGAVLGGVASAYSSYHLFFKPTKIQKTMQEMVNFGMR